jgi:ABC-2 type transport system ATP-binding protein
MPLVDLEHISRRYGKVQALNDVSLRLEPGTIGLVGNNGAGKSTLLKVLLGLLRPDAGRGTILGCDVLRSARDLRGQIGYMPEAAATVPILRGVEFVTLSGDLYGMPHGEARRRAHEVLNYVGLGELRYRRLEEYSTGNLQRLKLAAALVHDPQLLLLDEPTNGLDPPGRIAMVELLRDLIAETGKSVILCTHLLRDIEQLCEQVVVLNRGTVVHAGPMRQLLAVASDRYELNWQGDDAPFVAALGSAGVEIVPVELKGGLPTAKAVVRLPGGATTMLLFQRAQATGVVLTHVKPIEENLEQLFFRVTDQTPTRADTPPELLASTDDGN